MYCINIANVLLIYAGFDCGLPCVQAGAVTTTPVFKDQVKHILLFTATEQ